MITREQGTMSEDGGFVKHSLRKRPEKAGHERWGLSLSGGHWKWGDPGSSHEVA